MIYTVTQSSLRVRSSPSTLTGKVIASLPAGFKVRGKRVVSGAAVGGQTGWLEIDCENFVGESSYSKSLGYVSLYFLKKDTAEVTPPEEQANKIYRIGYNAIAGDGHQLAVEEAGKGCRYFVILNSNTLAYNIAKQYPDATVMVRKYTTAGHLSLRQMLDLLEVGANSQLLPNMVYIGYNEADTMAQDGPDLAERLKLDLETAAYIRSRGGFYAAGSFSMGTPEFLSDQVCKTIKDVISPAYNRGEIGFDMHLYSPNPDHIKDPAAHTWYETRWKFLFEKCGFDPRVRNIFCSETGLDEGGVGGFPAHSYSEQQIKEWIALNIQAQTAPIIVNGKQYESPVRGQAIFAVGDNGDARWKGYNVTQYIPTIREFYGKY
jgi:hypothetical protein